MISRFSGNKVTDFTKHSLYLHKHIQGYRQVKGEDKKLIVTMQTKVKMRCQVGEEFLLTTVTGGWVRDLLLRLHTILNQNKSKTSPKKTEDKKKIDFSLTLSTTSWMELYRWEKQAAMSHRLRNRFLNHPKGPPSIFDPVSFLVIYIFRRLQLPACTGSAWEAGGLKMVESWNVSLHKDMLCKTGWKHKDLQ